MSLVENGQSEVFMVNSLTIYPLKNFNLLLCRCDHAL